MPPEESPEAKYDRLKQQLQDLILKDYPNPERKGCPGDAALKELADHPLDQPFENGPHWHHVTHSPSATENSWHSNGRFEARPKPGECGLGGRWPLEWLSWRWG